MKERRKIIEIDQQLCDGCGMCIMHCVENAITIQDGKAKVISDILCDGLGNCLQSCPQNAIMIIERDALPFDEEAVRMLRKKNFPSPSKVYQQTVSFSPLDEYVLENKDFSFLKPMPKVCQSWPLKLRLMPANSLFLKNSSLLLVADCVPFVLSGFHKRYSNKVFLSICPKFEDYKYILEKLEGIFTQNTIKNFDVLRMEVPCCSSIKSIANKAIANLQEANVSNIPLPNHEICTRDGSIISQILQED